MAELSAGVKVDEAALEVAKQAARSDYDIFHNLREAVTCAINAYLSEAVPTQEVERLRGASRNLVVAVRMHNEMCRKLGITEGHGPGRWPEEVALSDLLALTPSVEGGE